jgi:hypothetical protein
MGQVHVYSVLVYFGFVMFFWLVLYRCVAFVFSIERNLPSYFSSYFSLSELGKKEVTLMEKFEKKTGKLTRLKDKIHALEEQLHANTESMEKMNSGFMEANKSVDSMTVNQLVGSREELTEHVRLLGNLFPKEPDLFRVKPCEMLMNNLEYLLNGNNANELDASHSNCQFALPDCFKKNPPTKLLSVVINDWQERSFGMIYSTD